MSFSIRNLSILPWTESSGGIGWDRTDDIRTSWGDFGRINVLRKRLRLLCVSAFARCWSSFSSSTYHPKSARLRFDNVHCIIV